MHDEMDILREVGSIAAAHGSIALSEILGKKITLTIPSVDIVAKTAVTSRIGDGKVNVAIIERILTSITGEAIFVLDEKDAFNIISLSHKFREDDRKIEVFTEMGISTLKEVGNIVTGAYLNAIGLILKRVILTAPPTLISGTVEEILNIIFSASEGEDYALLIEAIFEEKQEKIKGGFYLILSHESAVDIRNSCKRILDEVVQK